MPRWLVVVLGCPFLWSQPRPDPLNSNPLNSNKDWTVTGTVSDSITGGPISGATVIWEPSFATLGFRDRPLDPNGPSANAARVSTGASGAFTLSVDATATGARLFISRTGYRAQDGKASATVLARANSRAVAVRLVPQSAIVGRVTNAAGEPLAGIDMNAARVEIHDGRRQSRETYARSTNSAGEFRFDDLPPGAYYVRAAGKGDAPDSVYGPIYFPAAVGQDRAELLRVAPGDSKVADFRLESHKAYQIRGIITNMPLRKAVAIRLLRGDDPLSNAALITPNGTFTVSDVAPGSYTLQAYTPDVVPLEFGEVEVTVTSRDANAVKVTLSEGVDVAGHVEFRGSGSLEKYAVLYAMPYNSRRWPGDFKEPVVTMQPNGNFIFKNLLPGRYEIAVRGLPNSYLAEIHAETRETAEAPAASLDVLERGLSVPARDPPTLAIVMKSGGGEITGTVEGAAGSAPTGAVFNVALIERHGTADIPTLVRAPEGRFHIAGLTPGDYTLLAWPDSREIEYRNPAVLLDLLPYGSAVSLADGARRSLVLTPVP